VENFCNEYNQLSSMEYLVQKIQCQRALYNSPAKYEIILRYGMTSFTMLTQLLIKKQE